jgi:peptidoglycan/LPS O-acetylase OafA/YrhL
MQKLSLGVRDNNFDFLRFVAATLVLMGHCFWLSGRLSEEPLRPLTGGTDMADLAVDAFFVISGFLITASYLHGSGNISFILKRALRIFPGLAFAVIFALLVIGPLTTPLPLSEYFTDSKTVAFLTNTFLVTRYELPGVFASNPFPEVVNGSFWTLPLEGLMYCSVLLLGALKLLKREMVLLGLGVLIAGHFFVLPALGIESVTILKLFRLGLFFYAGAALYFYQDQVRWDGRIAMLSLAASTLALGSSAWFVVHMLTLPYLVIYLAYARLPKVAHFGKHGDFSYGMYIFGFPVQQLIIHWFGASINLAVFALSSMAITLCLAVLSWRLVEAPALRLKRYTNMKSLRADAR